MEIKIGFSSNPLKLVNARHGLFLINTNDNYIGRSLEKDGEYSEEESHILNRLLAPGKDAVEVGANIGSLSVPLAKKAKESNRNLLVIEPQPVVFQNLCANLALNGLWNVRTENIACSDSTGSLFFPLLDYGQSNNFGGISASVEGDSTNFQRIRCDTLDNIIPETFDVGLIKIDVEGFELEVLKGATQTIAKFQPVIYLENDRLDRSQALIEWLWAVDYDLWWHLPRHFSTNNFAGRAEGDNDNTVSINMIGLPKDGAISLTGFVKVESSTWNPVEDILRNSKSA